MDQEPVRKRSTPLHAALTACRRHFVAAGAFSAAVNLLYLTPTLYMLLVYDRVIPTNGELTLVIISAVGLLCLFTLAAFEWLRSRLLTRAGAQLEHDLAGPVMATVLSQPGLSRFERAQATRQFDILRHALAGQGSLAVFDAPWAPIYIIAAFLLHPAIGLLCLLSAGVLIVLALLNQRATRRPLERVGEAAAAAYAKQDQASASAAEVRALGMTAAIVAKQLDDRRAIIDLQTHTSFVAINYATIIRFTRLTLQSGVLALGAYLVIRQHLSPGAVIAASLLLSRALAPIEQIVSSWSGLVQAHFAYTKLSQRFNAQAGVRRTMVLPLPAGAVTLEAVSCLTGDRARLAIDAASVSIAAGEFVGVVGLSGAGKSTLLRLIAGAAEPDRGEIRIDGAALRDWGTQLAPHIGFLPQDFVLFAGSIRDNISRFGVFLGESDEGVDHKVVEAAVAAGIHDTILQLPRAYQTDLGPGGIGLSAGQSQRIALARALYGHPRILVLDEPNSHLDTESQHILAQLLALKKAGGATIIVSAHQPAILAGADKLLLLNNGRVELYGSLTDVAAEMRRRANAVRESASPRQASGG
jgi:ATP-binding cassette subfamily C exporter for protease/lipase